MTPLEQAARAEVVRVARSWLGTPYHHEARVRGAGVDCGQLLAAVYPAAGVGPASIEVEPYPADFMLHRDEERFRGIVERYARPLPAGVDPGPGDVALFRFGRVLSHAAIVTAWPMAVHAQAGVGVLEEDVLVNTALKERLVGFWSPWSEVLA